MPRTWPSPRWRQLSLRGLLLMVTFVAIGLGWWRSSAERQRRAVKTIEAAGGYIRYRHDFDAGGKLLPNAESPGPEWLRRLMGEHYFTTVEEVGFLGMDRVANRTAQPSIFIGVERKEVPVAALASLRDLPGIRRANFVVTTLSDGDLASIAMLRGLRYLRIDGNNITDAGLEHLRPLTQLNHLDVRATRVSPAAVARLRGEQQIAKIAYETHIEIPPSYWTTQSGPLPTPPATGK